MYSILFSVPDASAIPSTPSTVCGSTCSSVTPATSSGLALSVWSQSSGGKPPHDSPALSTSSTATELDEGSTQVEQTLDHNVDKSFSNSVEDNGSIPQDNSDAVGGAAGHESGAQEDSSFHNRGAKRVREHPRTRQHEQDGSGASCTPSDEHRPNAASPQEFASDLNSPTRKKECIEQSQYPRLNGQSTPATGPRSYRNQRGPSVVGEESIRRGRGDTSGGIFGGVMECPETMCAANPLTDCDENVEVGMTRDGSGGAFEVTSTENLLDEGSIDTCGAGAPVDSPNLSEKSDVEEMDFDGADREPPSTGDNLGETLIRSKLDGPGRTSRSLGGRHSQQLGSEEPLAAVMRVDQESTDKPMVVNATMEEAAALRQAGLTGDEESNELFSTLQSRLNWRWGGLINKLSNDYWIYKNGASAKTAKLGVDKFATKEDVVQYVRGVLGLSNATANANACNKDDTQDKEERDSVEIRDEVERDEKDVTNEQEEAGTASNQRGGLVSMPKGRVLQEALEALNPSNAPDVLQQRTTEFNQVLRFVTNSVEKASGGSLYLCGVPGTGKTQTMAHVQAKIHEKYSKASDLCISSDYCCGGPTLRFAFEPFAVPVSISMWVLTDLPRGEPPRSS